MPKLVEFVANTDPSERWFARFEGDELRHHVVGWAVTADHKVHACSQLSTGEVVISSTLPGFLEVVEH